MMVTSSKQKLLSEEISVICFQLKVIHTFKGDHFGASSDRSAPHDAASPTITTSVRRTEYNHDERSTYIFLAEGHCDIATVIRRRVPTTENRNQDSVHETNSNGSTASSRSQVIYHNERSRIKRCIGTLGLFIHYVASKAMP